jgi:protein-disulfide isomerase
MRDFFRSILGAGAILTLAWGTGCRPVEGWSPDSPDFDAAPDDGGAGALCPAGSADLFNNTYSPYLGGEQSVDLEVVDFSFFRCPHCAHFADTWEAIWADRDDFRARVRFYFHHFPFDYELAWSVHAAAVAAGNQGMENFWALHDYIFTQAYDNGNYVTMDDIRAYCADVLQLDMDQFEADLADPDTMAFLSWDKQQGLDAGVTGTPSVFICGEKISWSEIESVIDGYLYP